MTMFNQRRAPRVACEIPVCIHGHDSELYGTLYDVSRMGVRLRINLDSLDCAHDEELSRLGELVERHLGARFDMDLNHEALGPLVRKHVHVVRLGQECGEERALELGCEFGVPLSAQETGVLALDLPPLGTKEPPPALTGLTRQYDAYLLPTEGWGGGMLPGRTHGLNDRRATFRANPRSGLTLRDLEVSTMAIALAHEYGPAPVFEIVEGPHQLWAGRARIRHVESVPSESNSLCVHVETFG